MSHPFIHDDFLLESAEARELYHRFAANQPIIDLHNHLPPAQIAGNHQFPDLSSIWLAGDHYKWRAMRANGIPEDLVTGDASPYDKLAAWAETVPFTLCNPLYHWTHLEACRYFGFTDLVDEAAAPHLWKQANATLPQLRVHDLLQRHQVKVLCTTDDPADSLSTHQSIKHSGLDTRVYPTFRPDKALHIHSPTAFRAWLEKLEQVACTTVANFDDLLSTLKKRHDEFHAVGCRLSDHGLEQCPMAPCTHDEAYRIFDKVRNGISCLPEEQTAYASYLMLVFGRWDAARGWTKQLHLGAMRNNNSRCLHQLGPDTGFDSVGDFPQARALSTYMNTLDATGELPRMILYNLNPADNYVLGTMIGNFQDGSVAGKIQLGSGWWFLDQKDGMEWQLKTLSNLGLLRRFVGMVTDSRSFLSFSRHEYFRRILCNLLGQSMAKGEIPHDFGLIGSMVREICFENANEFFGFPE